MKGLEPSGLQEPDRLRSRPGCWRHRLGTELLPREAGVGCLWGLRRKPEKSSNYSPKGGLGACPGRAGGSQCFGGKPGLLPPLDTRDSASLRESPLSGFSPALFVQWPGLLEKGALDMEQDNPLFKDRKARSQTQSLDVEIFDQIQSCHTEKRLWTWRKTFVIQT